MVSDTPAIDKIIADCEDPAKLRRIMANAKQRGVDAVYDAAFHRLVVILPSMLKGTVAYDVWRTIHAFEELLTEERQKTTRLSRTRQAIRNKGEVRTVANLVLKKTPSDGFKILKERGLLKLSFEAVAIHHADCFEPEVVEKAHARLEEEGADIEAALAYWRGS